MCWHNPKGRIVIDDGRRFLKRTREKYDVIVVDPPPPVEAAGSSLLYSREFYELAKEHLQPGGILQIWFPGGTQATVQAVVRSLDESFPYVRCFRRGAWLGRRIFWVHATDRAGHGRGTGRPHAAQSPAGSHGMDGS